MPSRLLGYVETLFLLRNIYTDIHYVFTLQLKSIEFIVRFKQF